MMQFLEHQVIDSEIGPWYNEYNQKLYEKQNYAYFRTSVCYFLSQTFVFFCHKTSIVGKGEQYENKSNEIFEGNNAYGSRGCFGNDT